MLLLNQKFINHNAKSKFESSHISLRTGFDERHPNITTHDESKIYKINNYFRTKDLIQTLEDNEVGQLRKLELIQYYDFLFNNTMDIDIKAGGLLDDFNFENF